MHGFKLLLLPFASALPLLDSVINPITGSIWTTLDGLVQTSLGTLAGTLNAKQAYDIVVVGGGTAGNTLAYRLAQAGYTVAVVEAGLSYEVGKPIVGPAPLGDIIGVGSNPLDSIPTVDYGLKTTPQAGAGGRRMHYAQGKCLGGSSALNFMIHHRPNKGALDAWAEAVNDESYSFDQFLPYFQKSFTFTPPNVKTRLNNATTTYVESDFHPSSNSPIHVTYPNWTPVWSTWAAKGLEALGMNLTDQFNQGILNGFHYAQTTMNPGSQTRSTSADFIHAAKNANMDDKLTVYLGTRANKVLFDHDKKATGVEVSGNGLTKHIITANKEVILSAGAVHSPQLLMLSGIGPAEHLSKHGIKVLADRPGVGQNMTDHALFGPTYEVIFDTLSNVIGSPTALSKATLDYSLTQTGPLTNNVAEFLAWERMPSSANLSQSTWDQLLAFPEDWPHMEYFPAAGHIGFFDIPWADQPKDGKKYASIIAALAAPLSRGNVSLASSSPLDHPLVDPNWLTHPGDVEVAVAMYKRIREIFNTEAVQSIRASKVEYWPGLHVETDDQILANIRKSVMSVMHASCTARMGHRDDSTAVVDSLAKVIGVERLRVVDASSLALLPPGHPQALVYALAEKIADDIIKGLETHSG
ncbi:alcohol oxidase [Colletotrichum sublineola]|uniref:Putative choline dehydrogenase n=1 Tax=Colletotrichum sublineola TaxID=1173701 RepID=A0A066XK68_COLSU|nr:alcohol oxidase [Colletotrichum sublineola]KDN69292.1 putative choline dehydrogenase [Colletotrichum sublineola]